MPADFEKESHTLLHTPDVTRLKDAWMTHVRQTLDTATLKVPPADTWMQSGGKQGRHTEQLGYILAELQYMQRAYPASQW